MKIVPSILTSNLEEFKKQLEIVSSFSDEVDIDIIDGSLFSAVPTVSIEEALSIDTNLVRHIHLMVKNPSEYIKTALYYGVRSIIVHAEADLEWVNFTEIAVDKGIAIAPETSLEDIEAHLDKLNIVQVMTINPGKQGLELMKDQLEKVKKLKEMKYGFEVKVDGGVDQNTISDVEKAGTDTVSVGSAIWQSEDPRESFRALQEIVQNN